MKRVRISDITLKESEHKGAALTFKEKIEVAKLLDRLSVDVIEIDGIEKGRADILRIKSISQAVKKACIAVPVSQKTDDAAIVFEAMKEAPEKRLQVIMPVSNVQMEYLSHKKPDAFLAETLSRIAVCRSLTDNVELILQDATRADEAFLQKVITEACAAGTKVITVCDTAGDRLAWEFGEFISNLMEKVPALSGEALGISVSDALSQGSACAVAGIQRGAGEVKTSIAETGTVLTSDLARILSVKKDLLGAETGIEMSHLTGYREKVLRITNSEKKSGSPFEDGVRENQSESMLSVHDDEESVARIVKGMGYDLSDEDSLKVYEAFRKIADRKNAVSTKELEAIIASVAMQVPESYKLSTYTVTASNAIDALCHIKLMKDGKVLDGVSLGDGPIDAAFLAIEKITGCHYELDDFQLQAITEGREAMGQTIVRLRSRGKIYSGRGISTDIVGSGITAYINALNKIVYEEEDE